MRDDIFVDHWRYMDRISDDEYFQPGWRCWVYDRLCKIDIEGWMEVNMQGEYDCELKFNSGNPIYLIYIKEEKDAAYFALNFV